MPGLIAQQGLRAIPQSNFVVYIGAAVLGAGAFTATWGAVGLISDACLILAFGIALLHVIFGGLRFSTPAWMWIAPFGLLICIIARWFLPIPANLLAIRYIPSPHVPENVAKGAIWIAALVLVPLTIIAWSAIEPRTPHWVMGSFVGGVTISATISVTDLLRLTHVATSLGYESNNYRQTGLTDHPNTLGFTCAISIPIAMFFMARHGRLTWLGSRVAFVMLLGGVLACGSRGTQIATPIIVLATLMSASERRVALRNILVTLTVSTATLFAFIEALASDVLTELFRFSQAGSASAGDSDAERAILLKQAINDIETYPIFGLGIRHIVEAHNIYIQVLSSGGIVLGCAMLAYWLGLVSSCWKLRQAGNQLGACLLISVLTWLGLGIVENQLTDRLAYFTVGSVAALTSMRQITKREDSSYGARLRYTTNPASRICQVLSIGNGAVDKSGRASTNNSIGEST